MRAIVSLLFLLLALDVFSQEQLKKKNGEVVIKNERGIVVEKGNAHHHLRDGLWTKYYDTGEKKEEITYSDGLQNGPYRLYTRDGKLKKEGSLSNGKPTGEWKIYDSQQQVAVNEVYDSTGKPVRVEKYILGKLYETHVIAGGYEHVVQYKPGTGLPRKRYSMLDGKKEGFFVEYAMQPGADTSPVHVQRFYRGIPDGYDRYWDYDNGQRVLVREYWFKTGELDSVYKDYSLKDHKRKEGYYAHGVKNGIEKTWNDSVLTKITWYSTGKPDSAFEYYPDGKLKLVEKFRGPEQFHRKYFPNGQLEENVPLVNGRSQGPGTIYYPDGKKRTEVNYSSNVPNGEWKAWNEKGMLVIHAWCYYANDTLEYVYNDKGKKLAETDTAYSAQLIRYCPFNIHPKRNDKMPVDADEFLQPVVSEQVMEEEKPTEVFSYAEKMPAFPGGDIAFMDYLHKNMKYPEVEKEAGKQGTVYVTFTVMPDGKIADVQIAKGVAGAPGLSKEAIRVVSAMPDWIPGQMNGRNVAVRITQPVRFVME